MAFYASDLIKIATKEIGYHEKDSAGAVYGTASGSGNYTKYAKELADAGFFNGNKNGYDWCAVFVTWCAFKLTGNRDKAMKLLCQSGPYGAGCTQARSYYKSAGRYDKSPKVGDQVIFNSGSNLYVHTGIVIQVTSTAITTIEGNSANQVAQRIYKRTDSNIDGYGHPMYDAEPIQTLTMTLQYLKKGSTGNQVKALQEILYTLGYYKSTIDGDFGSVTDTAVKDFQRNRGIGVDGEVGKETWGKLLGVT